MSTLSHARRNLERASYTLIKSQPRPQQTPGRAWQKWSYAAALAPTATEFSSALDQLTRTRSIPDDQLALLQLFRAKLPPSVEEMGASVPLELAPDLQAINEDALLAFGRTIAQTRQDDVRTAAKNADALITAAQKSLASTPSQTPPALPGHLTVNSTALLFKYPGATVYHSKKTVPLTVRPTGLGDSTSTLGTASNPPMSGQSTQQEFVMVKTIPPAKPPAPRPQLSSLSIAELIRMAGDNSPEAIAMQLSLNTARQFGILGENLSVNTFRQAMSAAANSFQDLNHSFAVHGQVEPVGLLHLERLGFTPAGIERGELVHSVPLSPGEHVNIAHKEWSNTSEEFQSIVTDSLEAYSEQGVSEKSELTQSANSQSQHSSGFNLGVTASGGFGPVSISTSASFNVASSFSQSQQVSRQQSSELTRKASSRSKKEHKMSFKVASASGTEDQAVRRIRNPFPDQATRVDYYQLIRRWQLDLFRYGLRLTYDIVIPEPGSDILEKILQINALSAAIQQGFNAPDATEPWARFDVAPSDIGRDNFAALAAQYGTVVDSPPVAVIQAYRSFNQKWADEDQAKNREWNSFEIQVPDGYEVSGAKFSSLHWYWEEDHAYFAITTDFNGWWGSVNPVTLTVGTQYQQAYDIELTIYFGVTDETYQAWQLRVWGQLYDAAKANYEMNRAMLKDQLAALQAQLGAQDALSLRQIEREEVMKNVLRWLFGPGYKFVPPGLPADLYNAGETVVSKAVWSKVLAQGEIIRFLHQSIEWENMLYLLYPYFWSATSRWELKKYLDHPDFMHRAFLRSGSARVILTIRPGFETDFVSFLETGTFNALPGSHPYMTLAQEMQAYAQTNYPDIRSANPDHDVRPLLTPLQQRTWDDMQKIIALLEQYKTQNGDYPTTAQGLSILSGLGAVPPADAWGNPFSYVSPGIYAEFELQSFGADGVADGIDENADITSWAQASLIGRWYEYTPTSALDIAFNETLPSA